MATLQGLIKKGYLPKELPPVFTSEPLANAYAVPGTLPPNLFDAAPARKYCRSVTYNLGRPGSLRRRLMIPHPKYFVKLCAEIVNNWPDISAKFAANHSAASLPLPDNRTNGRELVGGHILSDTLLSRNVIRTGSRYLVRADVTNFYSSVYTHSIPWAIRTKAVAKLDHSDALYGNKLDKFVQRAQDGQTIGIPIGPDTSVVISELILCAVDEELYQRKPEMMMWRLVDDYEIPVSTMAEAESVIAMLQEVLSRYELTLNPRKTTILELPQHHMASWIHRLRAFKLGDDPIIRNRQLIKFFDQAVTAAQKYPEQHVMQYTLGHIRNATTVANSWPLLQSLMLQAFFSEPGGVPVAWDLIRKYLKEGCLFDPKAFSKTLNELVKRHAPMGHSSEVAWAMWMAIATRTSLDGTATSAICAMDDAIVAILALHARAKGLTPSGFDESNWMQYISADGLWGDKWLLAYEANIHGWLTTGSDYVATDDFFGPLKTAGVSFYKLISDADAMNWDDVASAEARDYEDLYAPGDDEDFDDEDAEEALEPGGPDF